MLRLTLAALLLTLSCRPNRDLSQYVEEDPRSSLASKLSLGDKTHEAQIKSGFHQIEAGGWRWASNKFSVELKPPFASQKIGAKLTLLGNVPEILISKTGPITLEAKLNGESLGKQTFAKAGEALFTLSVPPVGLNAEHLIFEFSTDKFLPPDTFPGDGRPLALIVSSIALETKK